MILEDAKVQRFHKLNNAIAQTENGFQVNKIIDFIERHFIASAIDHSCIVRHVASSCFLDEFGHGFFLEVEEVVADIKYFAVNQAWTENDVTNEDEAIRINRERANV